MDIFKPRASIDIAEEFDCDAYRENPESFGDHMFDVKKESNQGVQQSSSIVPTKQRMSMKKFIMA